MGKRKSWIIVIWSFIVLCIALICVNAMQTGEIPLDVSAPIANGISSALKADAESSKQISLFVREAAHFFEYFGLAVFFSLAYYLSFHKVMLGQKWGALNVFFSFLALPSSLAVALVDEGIQKLMSPARNGVLTDVLLDGAGALAGTLLFFFGALALHILFTSQKKKNRSKK